MKTCDYCQHCEMCGWRKDLEDMGCDFFSDGADWIPVTERLPEPGKRILVTAYGRVCYGIMDSRDGNSGAPLFIICDSVNNKRPVVFETTAHGEMTRTRITAWKPLPVPYTKGGGGMSEKEKINQLKAKIEDFSHSNKDFEKGVITGLFYAVTLLENGREYADQKVKMKP